jgi:hypothetical protein
MQTYWYVYKTYGGPPKHRHNFYEDAIEEAKRLVDTVGGEYEILQAVSVVKAAPKYVVDSCRPVVPPIRVITEDDENIPF